MEDFDLLSLVHFDIDVETNLMETMCPIVHPKQRHLHKYKAKE